jgi:5-methylcytosine-specific restriction endonuclease McrA
LGRVVEKPYNGGQWTKSRFHSFVTGALRMASNRWPPKYKARAKAKIRYGVYRCAGYGGIEPHECRAKEAKVDHIEPAVDPAIGFTTYDEFIKRLFVEEDGLQVLCDTCHNKKSNQEKEIRKNGKAKRT